MSVGESSGSTPGMIVWLNRWGVLAGGTIFSGAVVANAMANAVRVWLPRAFTSILMGLLAFGVLFIRFHLWIGSRHMTRRRVTLFLRGTLGVAGLLVLAGGAAVWYQGHAVDTLWVSIPIGMVLSAAYLWGRLGVFPETRGSVK